MKSPIQGIVTLIAILAGVGLAVQAVARAKGERVRKLGQYRQELMAMDAAITRLDQKIARESKTVAKVEDFYHAWIPEIQKCQDSDSLISAMLVDAYALNLVPMKKEVTRKQSFEFRGRMGTRDQIKVSVAGRYDRLVRFLDRVRRHYPFLSTDKIHLSVSDANVVMSMELTNCNLTIPEADLEELRLFDAREDRRWVDNGEDESTP